MAPGFTDRKLRFAGLLKEARNRAEMSQERAGAAVGTSRRHWIRWESGETMPNLAYLERIAAVLDAPELAEFAEDDEEDSSLPLSRDEFAMLGALMARLGMSLDKSKVKA